MQPDRTDELAALLDQRILILDGAMGTMIQGYRLDEAGYRGDVFPSLAMWEMAPTGVFASYPFPNALKVMRAGGF